MHFATFVAALVAAWHYFCAHAGTFAMVATVSGTFIAGLTNAPTGADSKPVALLKLFARFCGWAVHYDEPGSVKLPAGELVGLALKGGAAVYRVLKGNTAALLLFLGALAFSTGCPAAKQAAKQIAYDSAACAVGQVPAAVADTVQEAKDSLFGVAGTPSWSDFAKGDLMKFGVDAAICIVEAAIHDIDAAMATKGQLAPGTAGAHQLAVDWLAAHGVKHDHAATMRAMHADLRLRQFQLEAMSDAPDVCDTGASGGAATCRKIVVDDGVPAVAAADVAAK